MCITVILVSLWSIMDIIYFMKIKKNFMDIKKEKKKKKQNVRKKEQVSRSNRGRSDPPLFNFLLHLLFFLIIRISTVGKLIHLWKFSVPRNRSRIDTTHECEYKLKVKVRDCCTRKRCIKKIRSKIEENIEFEKIIINELGSFSITDASS